MFNLRKLRRARGLTIRDLAEQVGLSASIISYYENEKRKPSYEVLVKLSEALGCTIDELTGTATGPSYDGQNPESATEGDRILFNALRGATEEDKIRAAAIIKALREAEIGNSD